MHKFFSKYMMALGVTICFGLSAASLRAEDTKPQAEASTSKVEVIDIPSHLIMNLYRTPDKDTYSSNRWYQGLSLIGYWNPEYMWDQAQYRDNVTSFGLAIGKDFNKSHSMRLGLNYSAANYNNSLFEYDKYQVKRYALSLDYLWNLTNHYHGYDRSRRFHLLLSTGITAGLAQADEALRTVENLPSRTTIDPISQREVMTGGRGFVGLHFGPQFRYTVSPRVDLFAEPRVSLYSDGYDMGSNFHNVDFGANLLAGMAFRLNGPLSVMPDTSNVNANLFDNWFVQLYGGYSTAQSDYSPFGMDSEGGPGLNFGVNVGRWFNKPFGIQLGMFESVMGYAKEPAAESGRNFDYHRYMQLHGGRAEFLINPVYLLSDQVSVGRLGLTASVGLEAGAMKKHRGESRADYYTSSYLALTTAAQLRYFLNKDIAFFFEGRMTTPSYDVTAAHGEVGNYQDDILSLSAGIEFYNSLFSRYSRFGQRDSYQTKPIHSPQDNTWFLSGALGLGHQVHAGELFTEYIDQSVSLALGNVIDPYSAVRLRGGITFLPNSKQRNLSHSFLAQVGLDYMLNVSNLWMGVDPTRHFDLRLVAGPVAQLYNLSNKSEFELGWGASFGAQVAKKLNTNWEIFLEPRYQVLDEKMPNRWDLTAGLTYLFDDQYMLPYDPSKGMQGYYMQLLSGAQFGMYRKTESSFEPHARAGSFDFILGRSLNGLLSLQTGLFFNRLEIADNAPVEYFGGRFEGAFSFFRALSPSLADSHFNWIVSAGIEGGRLEGDYTTRRSRHGNFGLTAATQLQYRLGDRTWLLGQLRAQQINAGGVRLPLSAQVGMQYDLTDPKTDTHTDAANIYLHGGIGVLNADALAVEAGLGWNINPLHEVRLSAVTSLDRMGSVRNDHTYRWFSLSPNYLFNISNALLGEDPSRVVDMKLLAGLDVTMHGAKTALRNGKIGDALFHSDSYLGFNLGAQVSARLTDGLSFYLEPRLTIHPTDPYLGAHEHTAFNMFTQAGLRLDLNPSQHLIIDHTQGMQGYYLQLLTGSQFGALQKSKATFAGISQLDNFDFVVGRKMNNLASLQAGLFFNNVAFDHTGSINYWGGRAEGVFNFLQAFSPSLSDSRFNWTLSAGLEAGRMEGDYNTRHSRHFNLGVTAASQLQYRLSDRTWLLGQLRAQQLNLSGIRMPLTAQVGMQYDLTDPKTATHSDETNIYLHGGMGVFNADALAAEAGLGWNITPLHEVRLSAVMAFDRLQSLRNTTGQYRWLSLSPNYLFNISNALLGEDPSRVVDMKLLAGFDVTMHGLKSSLRNGKIGDALFHSDSYLGFNLGAQVSARLTDGLSFYLEPRFTIHPSDPYLGAHKHTAFNMFTQAGLRLDLNPSQHLIVDHTQGMQGYYLQLLAGSQFGTLQRSGVTFDGASQFGNFDFVVGRKMNNLASLQAGIFHNNVAFDHTGSMGYWGGRAEGVFNILRAFSPSLSDSRFNWTLSAGLEAGRMEGDYNTRHSRHFNLGVTAASQLQYRLSDRTWLLGQLRAQQLNLSGIRMPLTAQVGMQYDLTDPKTATHTDRVNVYVQGGAGFFNADAVAAEVALGWNINPRHEVRLGASTAFKEMESLRSDIGRYQWLSLSPNYLFNLSNALLGEDPSRVIDMKLVAGLDLTMHGVKNALRYGKIDQALFHSDTYLGFNLGAQVVARLSDGLSFYLEPRFSIQPSDPYLGKHNKTAFNLFTLAGLRLDLNPSTELRTIDATAMGREKAFVQANVVAQPLYLTKSAVNTGVHGHGLEFIYGSWWKHSLGWQGALVANSFKKHNSIATYGLRPELMIDLTSSINPDWTGKRFSAVLSGGAEVGGISWKRQDYFLVSPTAALQFRYRLPSDHVSLVAGTRGTAYMIPARGKIARNCFVPVSFNVGMQYNLKQSVPSLGSSVRQYANKETREKSYLQAIYRVQPALIQRSGLDLKRYAGHGAEITYGRWRGDIWGVQLGAYYDSYRWEYKEPVIAAGIRPELTLDVLGLLDPSMVGKRFSIVASAGIDWGNVDFDRLNYSDRSVGPTIGGQMRYRLNTLPMSVVVGGRASALKFNNAKSFTSNRIVPVSAEIGLQWNIFK